MQQYTERGEPWSPSSPPSTELPSVASVSLHVCRPYWTHYIALLGGNSSQDRKAESQRFAVVSKRQAFEFLGLVFLHVLVPKQSMKRFSLKFLWKLWNQRILLLPDKRTAHPNSQDWSSEMNFGLPFSFIYLPFCRSAPLPMGMDSGCRVSKGQGAPPRWPWGVSCFR
jgi:hypothetical protein